MSGLGDDFHVITARITDLQYILLKDKVEAKRHLSIQKVIVAAVNAFIREDFLILPDGSYTLGNPSAVYEGEDGEALDLDDVTHDPLASDVVEQWGTAQLAEYAERVTGRRVARRMLLILIREKYPQAHVNGPGKRYRWQTDDPVLRDIVADIADGELDRIRDGRMERFGSPHISAAPK